MTEIQTAAKAGAGRLTFPVYVYGHGLGEEPFHEEAHTLRVDANGALLLLKAFRCERGRSYC